MKEIHDALIQNGTYRGEEIYDHEEPAPPYEEEDEDHSTQLEFTVQTHPAYCQLRQRQGVGASAEIIWVAVRTAASATAARALGASVNIEVDLTGFYIHGCVEIAAITKDALRITAMAGPLALVEFMEPIDTQRELSCGPGPQSRASLNDVNHYLQSMTEHEQYILDVSQNLAKEIARDGERYAVQAPSFHYLLQAMEKSRQLLQENRSEMDAIVFGLLSQWRRGSKRLTLSNSDICDAVEQLTKDLRHPGVLAPLYRILAS